MQRRTRAGWSRHERAGRASGLYLLAPLLLCLSLPKALELRSGPWLGMGVRNLRVATLDPAGPAATAGLQVGDRLVEAGGEPLATMVDWFLVSERRPAPASLAGRVLREGRELDFALTPGRPPRERVIWAASLYLAGLAFLLIGWWVLWRRRDQVARDFFALCLIFAFLLMEAWVPPRWGWMILRESLRDLSQLLLAPLFLRFILSFPAQTTVAPPSRRRRRLLLAPVLPLFLASLWAQLAAVDPESLPVVTVQSAAFLYLLVCFTAALVSFARKALRRDRPVQQSKLRVVLLGLVAGLAPFLVGTALGSGPVGWSLPHREWLGFSLILVPLTFGVAILRYGALDAGFVVRHGLVYALSTLLLLCAYFGVVGLLGHVLTEAFDVDTYPLTLLLAGASALLALPLRRAVQRLIDRALYPERRASRAAVIELGRDLNGLIATDEAARTLVERLRGLYGPQRVSLFLAEGRERTLAEVVGWDGEHAVRPVYRLAAEGALARALLALRRPVFVEELREDADAASDAAGFDLVGRLDCELLVPLVNGNRLSGLLALGPRRDGTLYSQDDLANLQLLAVHSAAQLENTRLYSDSLSRERLAVELGVAQEIQARLLPSAPLELPGARLLGRMEPSREVGGDYFDYFPLPGERVGIAIADASGKGIPAALLMTQLRVAFRVEAARADDVDQVVSRLNEAACAPETAGNLVSFFYGVYDARAARLQYCNAGMNPPLLFRRANGRVEELRRGGPVLGASPGRAYRRGTVGLAAGDLVLFFTDGLTEETNAAGEFFDLERLVQAARDNLGAPLEQLREEIFATVSAFAGAERADDRTLMLLQVNPL